MEKSLWCCSTDVPRQRTTSTRLCCKNGHVPQMCAYVCCVPRICWVIWCPWLVRIPLWHVVTSTRLRIFPLVVAACATDTPTPVTSRIPAVQCAYSPVVASITRAAFSATNVAPVSSKRNGVRTPMHVPSTANVSRQIRTQCGNPCTNSYASSQPAIVMATATSANTTRRSTARASPWTFMDTTTAVAYARTASTTPKARTATSARQSTIVHVANSGTRQMSAVVSRAVLRVRTDLANCCSFTACNCDFFYSTGHCEEETGKCECRAAFQPPNCDSCSYG